jgi:isoquinoline 1-oxidoreductase subunit beta
MAFTADGKVAVMKHHASAGWPTAIMAQGFMAKGLHGMPYDPFAIAAAGHWHSVGVQRVRALSNDVANSAFRPGWLALGRARLDQLGGRELHGRGGPCGGRPILSPSASACWMAREATPGSAPNAVGGAKRQAAVVQRAAQKAGWACRHAEGHGAWHRDHIWTGTRYADLDRLRRARAGPTAAAVR